MLDVSVWAKSGLNAGPALSQLSADQFFLFFCIHLLLRTVWLKYFNI